jgi:MFS family permease
LHHIKEGWRYAFGFAPIRALIIFMGMVSMIGVPYTVLMPVFAKEILHGGADTLGMLTGASGFGALIAALMLANRKQVLGLGRWVIMGSGVFGMGIVLLSFTKNVPLSLAASAVVGFGMVTQMGAMNIILQSLLDEDKRGRVMSLYTLAFMGMMPLGSLLAGWSGEHLGVSRTIFYCGALTLVAAIWLAAQMPQLREQARPVYIAKGIINDIPAPIPEGK